MELYYTVGRDADQIAATRSDLLRWAARDAKSFLSDHPLPEEPLPAPDTAPYLAALSAAKSPAEVSAVTQRFKDAVEPALSAVSEVLVAIACWNGRDRSAEPGSPPKMLKSAAAQALAPLDLADLADLTVLRAEYDPAPPPPAPPQDRAAPNPPVAPPGAPGPKRAR
ncbi:MULTISPECIES: hypothetical protein [unclassified Streptomyces]|uniref:hypothetical protein n=1 Tax=unclassified Streptomyces TaxID=2593676 RepID=UPI000DC23B8A|nr:hypothetical protein [Streptomyces sp. PsTaAH-130]RAJ64210.1 hypothetical protein K376_01307 [Streptomyces sp. PsTaAH-130]